uniref:Uncharacterized protein n=1 Tax=Onchocerca volvulus TaxID=6282 RepID=A0A8R1XSB8_ONCVO
DYISFVATTKEDGPVRKSSIAGILVSCYENKEVCEKECLFTCHFTDHCNDSPLPKVACVPQLGLILFATFGFILFVACCFCYVCICVPVFFCYKWLLKWRIKQRNKRMIV